MATRQLEFGRLPDTQTHRKIKGIFSLPSFPHIRLWTIKAFRHPHDSVCSGTPPLLILLPSRPTSTGFLSSLIYTSVRASHPPTFPRVPSRAAVKRLLFVISARMVVGFGEGRVAAFSLASFMKRGGGGVELKGGGKKEQQRGLRLRRCKEALPA